MIEKEQFTLAEKIAIEAHAGQIRTRGEDKGKPYIIHPQRIASLFDDPYLKSVAILHDTLEDTDVTEKDLLDRGISPIVVDMVKVLSKKVGENYLDFILRIKADKWASRIKVADINDNMVSLDKGSLKDKYRLAKHILLH